MILLNKRKKNKKKVALTLAVMELGFFYNPMYEGLDGNKAEAKTAWSCADYPSAGQIITNSDGQTFCAGTPSGGSYAPQYWGQQEP